MNEQSTAPMRVGFAIPGDAAFAKSAISGGYAYDRRLVAGLSSLGIAVEHISLPRAYPLGDHSDEVCAGRALTAFDGVVLLDGLGCAAVDAALAAALSERLVALIHHPMHLEPGLTPDQSVALAERERSVVRQARKVIVTSHSTAEAVAKIFAVSPSDITVAEPGVDPAPRAACVGDPPHIVSVGAVIPRKGYSLLVEALAQLKALDWRLTIAGPLDADPAHADTMRDRIVAAGLEDRVSLCGALAPADMGALYQQADLFVSCASLEGYGMAVAEAINARLPVLALAPTVLDWAPHVETVDAPQDAEALANALRRLITDEAARRLAADASWAAAARLPRWERTAEIVAGVLREFTKKGASP